MTVVLEISGMDRWLKVADDNRLRSEVDRAVQAAASLLRDETKRLPPVSAKGTGYAALGIPVDTGRMRQAIRSQRNGPMAASVIADVNYSSYVHDGTARVQQRPFFRWVLEEFGGVEKVQALVNAAILRAVTP